MKSGVLKRLYTGNKKFSIRKFQNFGKRKPNFELSFCQLICAVMLFLSEPEFTQRQNEFVGIAGITSLLKHTADVII